MSVTEIFFLKTEEKFKKKEQKSMNMTMSKTLDLLLVCQFSPRSCQYMTVSVHTLLLLLLI